MSHLLVTNDFPPKQGGIQSYLWELWRRLPGDPVVLTGARRDAASWDAEQGFRIERTTRSVLLPTPDLRRRIDRLAAEVDAPIVLLDPALPLGALGRSLERPYGVIVHGAEVAVPGRLPGVRAGLAAVLRSAPARRGGRGLSGRGGRAGGRRVAADRRHSARRRRRPLPPARRRRRGPPHALASVCRSTARSCSDSAVWCLARASTCSSGRWPTWS